MKRTFTSLFALVICGLALASPDEPEQGKPKLTTLSEKDITEKLDGKKAKVTTVEVTLEPGQESTPHRHPGPVFGYVIEGAYEWAIDDEAAKTLKAGDTFYEPTGCLHRVCRRIRATPGPAFWLSCCIRGTRSRYPRRSRRSNTEDLCREMKVPELLYSRG